jgi:methyl-accepting chemotaxis protein
MHAFRNLSIRTKLMSSMVSCLLLFVAISTALGFVLTGASLRERVVGQELPAVVGEIRNDILRQISTPLAMARSVAGNSFVLDWEAAGRPEDGNAPGQGMPRPSSSRPGPHRCSGCRAARASISASRDQARKLAPKGQGDQWFTELLAGDKCRCWRSTRT